MTDITFELVDQPGTDVAFELIASSGSYRANAQFTRLVRTGD